LAWFFSVTRLVARGQLQIALGDDARPVVRAKIARQSVVSLVIADSLVAGHR